MWVVVRAGSLAWAVAGVGALALGLAGCGKTGQTGGSPGRASGGGSQAVAGSSNASAGAGASAGSGGGATAGSGAAGVGGTGGMEGALGAEPSDLRRLTAAEYQATVSDVLGASTKPDLAAFATEVDGFDNNSAANGVSDELYLRYLETAENVADEVFASDLLRPQIVTCAAVDDAGCVQSVISQVALRLFRRPALAEELTAYQKVYQRARARQEDHQGSLQDVLIALLASAQFLYRMEFVPTATGSQPLSPYDVATRLSYLLWSSAPDPTLLDAAAQDALSTDDELTGAVERLLQDPKSMRFGENFAGQWLGARKLTQVSLDPTLYPGWSPLVATAAASELELYFDELLQPGVDFAGFLDSTVHFANEELGQVYGVPLAHIDNQRIEVKDVDRRGVLGLAGFLIQTSAATRSSPSARGNWILKRLLCAPLPPPPADMPAFTASEDTIADYLQGLAAEPACATCHAAMDRLGLALENYDAIGRYRTIYAGRKPINAHVALPASSALPANMDVSGVAGLSQLLATAPAFDTCVAQKLYSYGFGRAVTDAERPNVQALASAWQSGPTTLRELVLHLVKSRTFRYRSDGGAR